MTVKELKEALASVDENKEVRIRIEDIVDNFGFTINARCFPQDAYELEFYFDIVGASDD